MDKCSSSFFENYRKIKFLVLGMILALGIGIRLYDLTDPPLDFHSTRQLWSAITVDKDTGEANTETLFDVPARQSA